MGGGELCKDPAALGRRRHRLDERIRVRLDAPRDLVGRGPARGRLLVPGDIRRWRGHPAEPREHTHESLREVDFTESRDLFAELALALLTPDREERLERERPEPLDDPPSGDLD